MRERLRAALEAGAPLLGLVTSEEDRALALAADAALDAGRSVVRLRWGLVDGQPRSLLQALAALSEPAPQTTYLVADLDAGFDDPLVARALKDACAALRRCGASLIGVLSRMSTPPSLERALRLMPLPLPTPSELAQVVQARLRAGGASEADADARAPRWGLAAGGMTSAELTEVVDEATRAGWWQSDEAEGRVRAAKRALRWSSGALSWTPPGTRWGHVGGMSALREWLERRRCALGPQARAFGLPSPRGVLLLGVQGCGKSLCAKAVGELWSIPLARLDLPLLFRQGAAAELEMQRALEAVEAVAPAALWIDEIDKVFSTAPGSGSSPATRALALLITWMQERQAEVPLVATANAVEALPPELLRKGRFDEIFFVDLPTEAERQHILAIHVERSGRAPAAFDLAAIAAETEHFSGAELERVVGEGLLEAFGAGEELHTRHLRMVASETVPLYETFEEPIRALRQWARGRARLASGESPIAALFGAARGHD